MTVLTFGVLICTLCLLFTVFYHLFYAPQKLAEAHAEGRQMGQHEIVLSKLKTKNQEIWHIFGFRTPHEMAAEFQSIVSQAVNFNQQEDHAGLMNNIVEILEDSSIPPEKRIFKFANLFVAFTMARMNAEEMIENKLDLIELSDQYPKKTESKRLELARTKKILNKMRLLTMTGMFSSPDDPSGNGSKVVMVSNIHDLREKLTEILGDKIATKVKEKEEERKEQSNENPFGAIE